MKKESKYEEIQSRREFFKNAAKKALPILGAIVLVNLPTITKAAETKTTNGCSCGSSCYGSCSGGCRDGCEGCSGSCQGRCYGCSGSCQSGCTSCRGDCSGTTS